MCVPVPVPVPLQYANYVTLGLLYMVKTGILAIPFGLEAGLPHGKHDQCKGPVLGCDTSASECEPDTCEEICHHEYSYDAKGCCESGQSEPTCCCRAY